jgi:hypothetical protein
MAQGAHVQHRRKRERVSHDHRFADVLTAIYPSAPISPGLSIEPAQPRGIDGCANPADEDPDARTELAIQWLRL